MSYARSRQRTRQMDERLIARNHGNFSYGMARQADIEGTDLPKNAAADGVNVRFHQVGWEGRPGCKLYQPADFGVTITDNTETLAVATQSGELYAANGDAAISTGDVFVVYGTGDFTGNDLETAKGYAPRKYDCFKFIDATSGSESVLYIGRLGVPAMVGYGDTPSTEFTASQSGTTITLTSGTISNDVVYGYFNWNDGTRCLIEEYLSSTTMRVTPSQTKASTTMCYIQPPVNATCFHEENNQVIALFGDRLYVSKQMPFAGWTEIYPIGEAYGSNIRPASSSQSLIVPDGEHAVLINQKAWYRIRLGAAPHYYRLNSIPPSVVITNEEEYSATTYEYKYNYTYSLARLTGAAITYDRTNSSGENVMVLEHESPPVKTAQGTIDWGYNWATRPVGPGTDYYGVLTGGALDAADQSPATWAAYSDAEFVISYNGTSYTVGVDFSGVTDMNDVCNRLQYACRTYDGMDKIEWSYVTDHIVVNTGEGETIGYVSAVSGGAGTDITGNLKLTDGVASEPANSSSYNAPTTVYYLSMPQDENGSTLNEWWHATHYPVYRTSNAADLPEGTEAHDYRWIADVPVAKAFTGSVSGTTLTLTDGTIEREDRNAVVFAQDGHYCTISTYTDSTHAEVTSITGPDGNAATSISSQSMAIGGGTVFTASQTGTTITVSSGKTLTDGDVGKQIFWKDGLQSIIVSVTNTTTATALTSAEHASQAATMDPVSRVFSDTITDDNIEQEYARYAGWPLRIRYQDAIPSGGLGAVTPGYILDAVQGSSKYVYSSRVYPWHLGYYNPGYQSYNRVIDGIQKFSVKDAKVLIYGSHSRYMLDTVYGTEVGETRIGESVTKLQDPVVLSTAVGTVPSSGASALESGDEILVTNEPAVRVISPDSESSNLAEKRIQKSDLQKMKPIYVGAYSPTTGWFLWGKQEI